MFYKKSFIIILFSTFHLTYSLKATDFCFLKNKITSNKNVKDYYKSITNNSRFDNIKDCDNKYIIYFRPYFTLW